ncbi:MAG: class I SAM-dependent methyltransferase [Alphaproteobacteria bacterium]|nr:class I SAM-dependent methyltransferase [Alphaproteobacteria bacterium]
METPFNLRPDAFQGAAEAYVRYRPPYPKAMLAALLAQAGRGGGGVLVDLACGPGRVALDLAHAFDAVIAIDLEPEMVAAGAREAARRGVGKVSWRVGRAEAAEIAAGSADLVTIGEAFHRLDQGVVAARALGWLKPGGCLATMGTEPILRGGEPWKDAVAAVAFGWAERGSGGWAPARVGAELEPAGIEGVLRAAGFAMVTSHEVFEPRTWSFEEIAGWLRSLSICSDRALGGDRAAFERELLAALGGDATQVFREEMKASWTLARKA